MGVNKVEFGDETLIDLTNDTVDEQSVLEGRSFHAKDGTVKEGKVVVAEVIDNLTSTSTTDALSANQGRELNENKLGTDLENIDDTGIERIKEIAGESSVPDNVVLYEDETTLEEPLPRDADLLAGREPSYYAKASDVATVNTSIEEINESIDEINEDIDKVKTDVNEINQNLTAQDGEQFRYAKQDGVRGILVNEGGADTFFPFSKSSYPNKEGYIYNPQMLANYQLSDVYKVSADVTPRITATWDNSKSLLNAYFELKCDNGSTTANGYRAIEFDEFDFSPYKTIEFDIECTSHTGGIGTVYYGITDETTVTNSYSNFISGYNSDFNVSVQKYTKSIDVSNLSGKHKVKIVARQYTGYGSIIRLNRIQLKK